MRVVWNIVENTDIDNLERVATTLRNFGRMIRSIANSLDCESEFGVSRERVHDVVKTTSFYHAMANCANMPATDEDNRWTRPFKEEMEKAKRISEDSAWLDQFLHMEKHTYFKGITNFYYTDGMTSYEDLTGWNLQVAIACNALRKDVRLHNWIMEQPSPVYVHAKNGHIAVAIPVYQ